DVEPLQARRDPRGDRDRVRIGRLQDDARVVALLAHGAGADDGEILVDGDVLRVRPRGDEHRAARLRVGHAQRERGIRVLGGAVGAVARAVGRDVYDVLRARGRGRVRVGDAVAWTAAAAGDEE